MIHADIAGLTPGEHEKMFEEMMIAFGDCLSNLSSSDDEEDGDGQDDKIQSWAS